MNKFVLDQNDTWVAILCMVFGITLLIIQIELVSLFGMIDPEWTNPNRTFISAGFNIAALLTTVLMCYPMIDIAFRDENGKFRWV